MVTCLSNRTQTGSLPVRITKREVTKVLSTGGQEPSVSRFDSDLLDKYKDVDRLMKGSPMEGRVWV